MVESETMIEKPVALVTGGAKGIGAACCRALAAEGFHVGIHYNKSAESAQQLLDEIKEGFLIQADLSDIEQVDAMIGTIKDTVGRVDVLVNNAGHSINADIISMKVEQFDEQAGADARRLVSDEKNFASIHDSEFSRSHYQYFQCCRPYRQRRPDSLHDGKSGA